MFGFAMAFGLVYGALWSTRQLPKVVGSLTVFMWGAERKRNKELEEEVERMERLGLSKDQLQNGVVLHPFKLSRKDVEAPWDGEDCRLGFLISKPLLLTNKEVFELNALIAFVRDEESRGVSFPEDIRPSKFVRISSARMEDSLLNESFSPELKQLVDEVQSKNS